MSAATFTGCLIRPSGLGCRRSVHAEVNAVLNATLSPCFGCLKMLQNAGVVRIVYSERYRIFDEVEQETREMGVSLEQLV